LKTAILLGISKSEFDDMTPYELTLHAECFLELKEAEIQEKITLVWLHEYYHRQEYLPALKDEIKKFSNKETKEMTDEEMLAVVKSLNAQMGGSVITKDGE
jgi:hypothetical protein